jgi:RNA polymerase sigma-70 factor (ECF subfamily)
MSLESSERELIAKAVAGERAALKRLLLSRHDGLVRHVEQRMPADLRGGLSGEDVCQEAYVVIFQEITSLRAVDVRVLDSWLFTVVENKLKDAIRARRAEKRGGGWRGAGDESSTAELIELARPDEHTPSRSVARREIIARVHAVLDQLPSDYGKALRLHYLEGLTVAETAQQMGRSEGAVLMLCNRALRAAAALLGDSAQFLSRNA